MLFYVDLGTKNSAIMAKFPMGLDGPCFMGAAGQKWPFPLGARRGGILLQTGPRLTSVSHMASRMYPKDPPWPYEVLETSFGGSQNLRFSGFGEESPRPENFSQFFFKPVFSGCFRDKSVQNL